MRFWRRKRPQPYCSQSGPCDCRSNKNAVCETCKFYSTIDSGYGWCKVFPEFKPTPWCRDICGQFQGR